MAHHCPDCGEICYCDMEDCLNDLDYDILNCTHCLTPECDGHEGNDDEYDDPESEVK